MAVFLMEVCFKCVTDVVPGCYEVRILCDVLQVVCLAWLFICLSLYRTWSRVLLTKRLSYAQSPVGHWADMHTGLLASLTNFIFVLWWLRYFWAEHETCCIKYMYCVHVNVWPNAPIWMRDELRSKIMVALGLFVSICFFIWSSRKICYFSYCTVFMQFLKFAFVIWQQLQ